MPKSLISRLAHCVIASIAMATMPGCQLACVHCSHSVPRQTIVVGQPVQRMMPHSINSSDCTNCSQASPLAAEPTPHTERSSTRSILRDEPLFVIDSSYNDIDPIRPAHGARNPMSEHAGNVKDVVTPPADLKIPSGR